MTTEEQIQKMARSVNSIIFKHFPEFLVRQPRYRYWKDEKNNRYFYTTEKINHRGNPRYVAGIYRYLKTKKQWKLVKEVGFAKKKKAIEWAYRKYQRSAK